MSFNHLSKNIFFSILYILSLTGCGGGDSSTSNSSNSNSNNTPKAQVSTNAVENKIFLNLQANILDNNNKPLNDFNIEIFQNSAKIISSTAAVKQFSIEKGLPVTVRISKDGYSDYTYNIDSNNKNFDSQVKASLIPNTYKDTNLSLDKFISSNASLSSGAWISIKPNSLVDIKSNVMSKLFDLEVFVIDPAKNIKIIPASMLINNSGIKEFLPSLGMVNFYFKQGVNKLNLASGYSAVINVPLFNIYDNNGKVIKEGDTIPFWQLDDQGIWKEQGVGTVTNEGYSPTGLAVKVITNKISWINLSYGLIPTINKTVQILDKNNNTSTKNIILTTYFTKTINKNLYGNSSVASQINFISQNNASIDVPVGFDINIESNNIDNNEIKPINLTWADINNSQPISLNLQALQARIKILPSNDFTIQKGDDKTLSYELSNTEDKLMWYVDDIENGNNQVGNIYFYQNNIIYSTSLQATGVHTITAVSANNPNIKFSIKANVVDKLDIDAE